MKLSKHFLFFFLFGFSFVNAQTPEEELAKMVDSHPNNDVVYENSNAFIRFYMDEEELKSTYTIEKTLFLLTDKADYYGKEEVSYSHFFDLKELEAYTLVPKTKKYAKSIVKDFVDKDDLGGMSFHDDNKLRIFEYTDLEKGAKRFLNYTYEVKEPALLGSFRFGESVPSKSSYLEIVTDKDVELGYILFNQDEIEIDFNETINKDGQKVYQWRALNVDEIEYEVGSPNYRYFTPHVVYYVKSYKQNGKEVNLLNGVEGLHQYYNYFLEDINVEQYEPLKEKVNELISDDMSDLDIVKTVYKWVQDNIKYVAFEDGYGGFIPRQASEIYQRRFGDCKDMASIIHEMLKYAGVESHWTWIGSRDIPYKYTDVATPIVDNHMINTYIEDGKYYFLDGTDSNVPFGMPTSFIQGKEALIHVSEDSFIVHQVPIVPAIQNAVKDSVYITLKDDEIIGQGWSAYTGYHRNKIIRYLGDVEGDERKNDVKNYVSKGNNKFALISFEEFNQKDKDLPYELTFDFTLQDYVVQADDKMYVNLNLDRFFESMNFKEDRKTPYELDYKQHFRSVVEFEIPNNYQLSSLPQSHELKEDDYSFKSEYKQIGNNIQFSIDIAFNFIYLEVDEIEAFNKFLKELKNTYKEVVVLENKEL